jgi:hypothetical protein
MEADRLPDVSIDMQVVAANAVCFQLGCGEDYDWQTVEPVILSNMLQDTDAIDLRYIEVEE